MKRLIRSRHRALYDALGVAIAEDPNAVDYYTILDLEILGTERYGRGFVEWLVATKNPLEILFRLADESSIVLLPGKGFATPHPDGYYYDPAYGCEPLSYFYGPPTYVYPDYGFGFFYGGGWGRGGHGFGHGGGHPGGGFHGGVHGGGGGFHGGGGHGGGHR
jgi:hypothetical protein